MLKTPKQTQQTLTDSAILTRIAEHARNRPESIAIEDSHKQLSYADLHAEIKKLSARLQSSGFKQLGLLMENSCDWILCQLAALDADICVTPIPLFFSNQQVRHLLDSCGIELLLCDRLSRLEMLGIDALLRPDIHIGAARLCGSATKPLYRPQSTRLITFTSGTTGSPKGVCLSSKSLDRLCHSLYLQIEPLQIERHCSLLPLSVLLEHVAGALLSLYAGARCSLFAAEHTGLCGSAQLDPHALAALLQRCQPHSLILVPELLQALLGLASHRLLPDSLRFVAVGGGHIAPQLLQRVKQLSLPVYEGYGLSECGSVVSLNTPQQQSIGSVGRALPHCQLRLSDEGEILVKGSSMLGYLGEPVLEQGWFATGDLGHIDEFGYLYIQGRKRNILINSYGRNLSPEWIETELCACPQIAQACLFGDAKPFNIALLTATEMGSAESIALWIEQLNSRLPDYARVGDWILTNEPFSCSNDELTTNGRLRRKAIKEHYLEAIAAAYLCVAEPYTSNKHVLNKHPLGPSAVTTKPPQAPKTQIYRTEEL